MRNLASCLLLTFALSTSIYASGDWSQFLGSNRDGVASDFQTPDSWPKELSKAWSLEVGDGLASPVLVDGKLYAFTRADGNEVTYCLDAESGREIWKDAGYESPAIEGPAAYHVGPRSVPAVGDGKVVTLGVHGVLSCLDADTGKVVWRKESFTGEIPRFFTSSSPLIVDGLAILQVGQLAAYDLDSGDVVWSWAEDGASYASSALLNLGGTAAVITPTQSNLIVLQASSGKVLYEMSFNQGRQNTATPAADGDIVYVAGPGRGMTAYQFVKSGDGYDTEQLWQNPENSIGNSNPIHAGGHVFGISGSNALFAINATSGDTVWTSQVGPVAAPRGQGGRGQGRQGQQGGAGGERMRAPGGGDQAQTGGQGGQRMRPQGGQQGGRGPGGRGQGGRGAGRTPSGFGSIVSVGSALIALTPSSELVVLEPGADSAKELARYKVSQSQTYAYPVVAGDAIYIKDQTSLTAYSVN